MPIKLFNWYGGKQRVLGEILSCVPHHITNWYDACMGSAVVTLNAPRHQIEMVSDLDDELIHLVSLLADKIMGANLVDRLIGLLWSEQVFKQALKAKENGYRGLNDYEKAEMIFITISQSFNSARKNFSRKGSGKNQRDYTNTLLANLPLVYERLQGVRVRKIDCVEVVDKTRNNPNSFVFLDVPYRWELRGVGARNVYGFEMDRKHHLHLLETCRDAKSCIMLCGYHQTVGIDMYDYYLGVGQPDSLWRRYTLAELRKSCQTTTKRDVAVETIWVNYELPPMARYYISMKEDKSEYQVLTSPDQGVTIPTTLKEDVA